MARAARPVRADYAVFRPIQTRWIDNDVYGHVNNVRSYEYFDTVVNGWLIEAGVLDIAASAQIGLVVETNCRYFEPLVFPQMLEGGLRTDRIGTSSVTYAVGIFAKGAEEAASAGTFAHVYVDRETRRPMPLAPALRDALATLEISAAG